MTESDFYGCMLTGKFDWSTDNASNKWSTPQQAYKLSTKRLALASGIEADYPYAIIDTRLRLRGTGRAVVLRYESEPGKDFELVGRVTPFTAETEG
jgi:hypothetical protein